MTSQSSGGGAASTAERAAQHPVLERFARAGYVGSGLVHLLIGYIAVRIAFGGEDGSADQSGAMAELAEQPGGRFVLWACVVVFVMMGIWRIAEATFGSASRPDAVDPKDRAFDRIKALSLAVVYFAFALMAFGFARGNGSSSSEQNTSLTASLMESTLGKIALIVGALIIIGVGAYHVHKGATCNFVDDLKGSTGQAVRSLGLVGYVAKGLSIGVIGVLVILAVFQSQPDKAAGLDGAIKTLGAQPYGAVLLVVAGVGIAVYGLYSFVMARYAKM
ncbi:DUF1206 domain-containing protein [Rhodococcus chondri]|uniref:DUF1206 domain-containing protein n=1 Tax=Rhodococcus chondri TaxID=3065941 RepID=A0ABU7JU08_9NOCA|nr:DUF1206 domain-containing protein [Rhodococcus sp. CC-R104]MEE2032757.1 DUF1206 domain-containing protein [Rhodococcus sp. CC-R104]